MSAAWIQSTSTFTGTGTDNATATYVTTPTAGNLLVCAMWSYSMNQATGNKFNTPTDTAGNTYHLAGVLTDTSGNDDGTGIIYYAWDCLTHASNVVTESVPAGQSVDVMCCSEYSGVQNTSDPKTTSNTAVVTGGATTQVTLSSVILNSLLVWIAHQDGTTITAATPTGSNIRYSDNSIDRVSYCDKLASASGSVTVGVTPADSANGDIIAVAFKIPSSSAPHDPIFFSMDF